jgi:hypothetical protein
MLASNSLINTNKAIPEKPILNRVGELKTIIMEQIKKKHEEEIKKQQYINIKVIESNSNSNIVIAHHSGEFYDKLLLTLFKSKKTIYDDIFRLEDQKRAKEVVFNLINKNPLWIDPDTTYNEYKGLLEMNLGDPNGALVWSKEELEKISKNNTKIILFSGSEEEVENAKNKIKGWELSKLVEVYKKPLGQENLKWLFK